MQETPVDIAEMKYVDENQVAKFDFDKPGEHLKILESNDNQYPVCWLPEIKSEPLGKLMSFHIFWNLL